MEFNVLYTMPKNDSVDEYTARTVEFVTTPVFIS